MSDHGVAQAAGLQSRAGTADADSDAANTMALPRELTIYQVGALSTELASRIASGGALTLDAAEVVELDGAGVQLLLALRRHAQSLGRTFSVVRPSDEFEETLTLLGLDLLAISAPGS